MNNTFLFYTVSIDKKIKKTQHLVIGLDLYKSFYENLTVTKIKLLQRKEMKN